MRSEATTVTTATTADYDVPFAEGTPIGLVILGSYGSGDDRDTMIAPNNSSNNNDSKDDDSWVSQWSDIVPPEDQHTVRLDPRKVMIVIATLVFTAYLILLYYYIMTWRHDDNSIFSSDDKANFIKGSSKSIEGNLQDHSSLSAVMQQVHHLRHELVH